MNEVFAWPDAPHAEFAVIGHPVTHSLSPRMHNAAFAALELPYRYVAIEVPVGEVGFALDHLRAIGYQGVNVTVPHKFEAMEWCKQVDPFAHRARAVNTIRPATKEGTNTDGPGFVRFAQIGLTPPSDRHVLMLGAGGSAMSISLAIADAGEVVRVWNRTPARAESLVADLDHPNVRYEPDLTLDGAWMVVNATSASLQGDPLPIEWRTSTPLDVIDLMYGDGVTPFLNAAQLSGVGHRLADGRALLVEQGALAFEWWTGDAAARSTMRMAVGL